jgi:aminopeptidase YwaD
MKRRFTLIAITTLVFFSYGSYGQNSELRTLLPGKIIDELIGEASGEKAMNHIIEMAAYIHDRPASEYSGYFYETAYVMAKLKEYGLEGVKVNEYPGSQTWDGIKATLWEISPGRQKLADYTDLPAVLASGSANADVTADLVWVGEGRQMDIEKVDLQGKIAVSSGSISMVHNLAVAKGAVGVISFNSPRPLEVPMAIPITGIGSRRGDATGSKFGFFLPPREGTLLRDRLLRGEKIRVHAVVESQNLEYKLEVPECIIRGTDPEAGEVIFSAHIFEGFVKMGANDNISGSAAILEIARMLGTMIDEGRIERPLRTIRFIWVPEFAGTGPWVNDHKAITAKTLCNINLDMVGLRLKESQSFLCMHRTTYGNPHYLNDVMQNYYDFTGMANKANLAITGRDGFAKPVVAMTGSDDPFYYSIDDHYGSSDHEVFNDWGVQVPGIMMITWPDLFYHTSQDIADKCDATQLKRVCFIGAAAAYTIANAGDGMASRIAGEVAGNAAARIGKQLQRAIYELERAEASNFEALYKKTRGYIEAAVINEKATLLTTTELVRVLPSWNDEYAGAIDISGKSALAGLDAFARSKATALGIKSLDYKLSALETKARSIIPKPTAAVTAKGYRGFSEAIMNVNPQLRQQFTPTNRMTDTHELARLCNGRNSALDIKKMLDTQMKNGEVNLQDVINYISLLKEAGLVTL